MDPMDPLGYGDPIDPNEPITEPLIDASGYHAAYGNVDGYGGYPPPAGYRPAETYPDYHQPDRRPGEGVAGAVLGLVTSGLLLVTGFIVIFAASSLGSADGDIASTQRTGLFVGAGFMNVVVAGLLILGAVL